MKTPRTETILLVGLLVIIVILAGALRTSWQNERDLSDLINRYKMNPAAK